MYLLHILLYICHRATTLSLKHMNETECRFKTEVDFVSLIFLFFFLFGKISLLLLSEVVICRNVKVSVFFPDDQICEGCVFRLCSYVVQSHERNVYLFISPVHSQFSNNPISWQFKAYTWHSLNLKYDNIIGEKSGIS